MNPLSLILYVTCVTGCAVESAVNRLLGIDEIGFHSLRGMGDKNQMVPEFYPWSRLANKLFLAARFVRSEE